MATFLPGRRSVGAKDKTDYRRRRPEETVLFRVVQRHWLTFVARVESAGHDVPDFVREEFEAFLRCGILAHGTTVTY